MRRITQQHTFTVHHHGMNNIICSRKRPQDGVNSVELDEAKSTKRAITVQTIIEGDYGRIFDLHVYM